MTPDAIITLMVIIGAVVLFATEWVSIDVVALLIIVTLVVTGVISPEEGVEGFSNSATITVLFMFILSAAILKTGALQYFAYRLAKVFRNNFLWGMLLMMLMIAGLSAFVNNTPVVAVFIPVILQIASASGRHPGKMLIPLSYASIFGGTCTLIGTSTNILVSGIAEKNGLGSFDMFLLSPVGIIFLVIGCIYMIFIGIRLLPTRESQGLEQKFGIKNYLTQIELLENAASAGKRIMDAPLVKELEMDIIEVRRNGQTFTLPPGDFVLQSGDVLKVRCDVEKMKQLKDRIKINVNAPLKIGGDTLKGENSTLVELVITSYSGFYNKTLRELDFRRKYRAIPLAIRHREEVTHDDLYEVKLRPGDIILAEVKTHYLNEIRKMERNQNFPFVLLSQNTLTDFNKKNFYLVLSVMTGIILLATLNILPIMIAAIIGVVILVLSKCISMKDAYQAVSWNIVFLLAGALTLGTAMSNSGLDSFIAANLVGNLGPWGVVAVISGLYLITSLFTEVMSNNATAALMAPIAIATAAKMEANPIPFLIAITIAASASFMTPVGYQTNTMVYSAGQYRFRDFIKVGAVLNVLFWLIASFAIPYIYGI